jgi:hypothetical protein
MINKNYNNLNKKAMATMTFVGVVISLISMFLISDFIFTTSDLTTTVAEDANCKKSVALKSSSTVKLYEFIEELNHNCKTEYKELKTDVKTENLKSISNSMTKCWDRFGAGEFDFLSNFDTEGNWCFTCAKLHSDESINPISFSTDLIPYQKNNSITLSNGSSIFYYDYMRMKYYDGNDLTQLEEINDGIDELSNMIGDTDAITQPLIDSMYNKNKEIFDLALKNNDFSNDVYVVYRYDRIPKDVLEIAGDIGQGVLAGMAVETVLIGGAGLVLAPFTFGASLALTAAQLAKVANKLGKTYSIGKDLIKFKEVLNKIGKSIKFSKPTKLGNIVSKFEDSITSLASTGKKLSKVDSDLGNQVTSLTDDLTKLGIKHIDDLDILISSKSKQIENLQDITIKAINSGLLKNKGLTRLAKRETELNDELLGLQKLSTEIVDLKSKGKLTPSLSAELLKGTTRFMGKVASVVGVSGATGGFVAAPNSNYVQYVDLLNKEQYYRLCGTEPIISK